MEELTHRIVLYGDGHAVWRHRCAYGIKKTYAPAAI